jgi:ATP phosphoribosyltransferase
LESNTKLIANKKSWKDSKKRKKLEILKMLLTGAIISEEKVGLKMNVNKEDVNKIIKILPALKKPTVSGLVNDSFVAIDTIVDEKIVRDLIPKLKEAGASGIVEYPLNKIIP